jgi:hypothetical protein
MPMICLSKVEPLRKMVMAWRLLLVKSYLKNCLIWRGGRITHSGTRFVRACLPALFRPSGPNQLVPLGYCAASRYGYKSPLHFFLLVKQHSCEATCSLGFSPCMTRWWPAIQGGKCSSTTPFAFGATWIFLLVGTLWSVSVQSMFSCLKHPQPCSLRSYLHSILIKCCFSNYISSLQN